MYDFDTLTDRRNTGACKWDRRSAEEAAMGIVPMSIADMEFQVAPCVREAVVRAAQHGVYGYTDPSPAYLAAVCGWMQTRHHCPVNPGDILPICGVVPALCTAINAFTKPGEGVIIQTPVYPPFAASIRKNGRRVESAPLTCVNGRYEMDFEALENAAKKPDAKLFLLCSPHNPVGRVWTRAELEKVCDICAQNGVIVASDEIHADLVLKGEHIPFLNVSPKAREISLIFVAASKTFNVPGLQLASVIAPDAGIRARFHDAELAAGLENMSYFGHAASIAAYTQGADWLDAAIDYIRGNYECLRDFLKERLPALKVADLEGTYLAWIDCRALGLDDKALAAFARQKARLILGEGVNFGAEGSGFLRWNLAVPRHCLMEGLERLDAAIRAL